MLKFSQLSSRQKRQHLKVVREVLASGSKFFRGEVSFRIVERLHKAGLVIAYVTKWSWRGCRRPFRELEARPINIKPLPRGG